MRQRSDQCGVFINPRRSQRVAITAQPQARGAGLAGLVVPAQDGDPAAPEREQVLDPGQRRAGVVDGDVVLGAAEDTVAQ